MKTLLKNGTVVSGDMSVIEDVLIDGEKIVKVGRNLEAEDAQVVDVNGIKLLATSVDGVDMNGLRDLGDSLKEKLGEVLSTLTEREEKVLRLRFGLEDGRSRTLEEVGKEFDVTRERIRQIEAKALRKLRHPSRSKKVKDFLD